MELGDNVQGEGCPLKVGDKVFGFTLVRYWQLTSRLLEIPVCFTTTFHTFWRPVSRNRLTKPSCSSSIFVTDIRPLFSMCSSLEAMPSMQ